VLEKSFKLKNIENRYPIVQGGMGVGVSLFELASAVGKKDCVGTISSAILDQLVPLRVGGDRMSNIEAAEREVFDTKQVGGVAAINIMCALVSSYEDSLEGAIKGGVDMVVSGAGLPMNLPSQVKKIVGTNDHDVNLVPIVSSARALELICKKWERQGYRPDAIVLEGPKAGGHIGWSYKQVIEAGADFLKKYDLFDELLKPVLEVAGKYRNDSGAIPVIVAGGVYTYGDIRQALYLGASAVQMGTRFAATKESGFTDESKQLIVEAREEDIVLGDDYWGSPCKLPFRYLKKSPLVDEDRKGNDFCICTTLLGGVGVDNSEKLGTKEFQRGCPEKYVLLPGKICPATGATNYTPMVSTGTEGYRVDKILSVDELVDELVGL
tara:strand:- start:651 stop:1793 length:1143 start_codon:yes stop_codon:yes gene_type:complete